MGLTTVRNRLAAIEKLARFFAGKHLRSWEPRATFNAVEHFTVGGTRITVAYSVNVLPHGGGGEGVFRSLVTLSPERPSKVSRGQGWDATLLKLGWYRQCDKHLRSFAYRGTWLGTDWGRVGYFTKRHSGAGSLEAEVDTLESIRAEHRALWKRRRTMR